MTTILNVAVMPIVSAYVERLDQRITEQDIAAPLLLMKSSGGVTSARNVRRAPVETALSGPAAGAVGATFVGAGAGIKNLIGIDIGGTSADVCLIHDGKPGLTTSGHVGAWPLGLPMVDIVTIGAGGGSIARVSGNGALTVGPQSAGAVPGPVCYGRGGEEPTVTDANVVLGKIDPAHFAGGKIPLDLPAAVAALRAHVGEPLQISGPWAAAGVAEIVEENMANAARVHAIERGKDISACAMVAFGGGAPLHACRLADKLGIDRIVVPRGAGVGSAIGFLKAPIAYEITRSAAPRFDPFDADRANAMLDDMERHATAIVAPALAGARPVVSRIADCRYVGQGHEIQVALPARRLAAADGAWLRGEFERLYRLIYGLTIPGMEAEAVTWSLTVSSPPRQVARAGSVPAERPAKPRSTRDTFDPASGATTATPLYWRFDLEPGSVLDGPAIIAEDETSTVVGANFRAVIDALGYIVLSRK
jgi:N-methylhydantoinase A